MAGKQDVEQQGHDEPVVLQPVGNVEEAFGGGFFPGLAQQFLGVAQGLFGGDGRDGITGGDAGHGAQGIFAPGHVHDGHTHQVQPPVQFAAQQVAPRGGAAAHPVFAHVAAEGDLQQVPHEGLGGEFRLLVQSLEVAAVAHQLLQGEPVGGHPFHGHFEEVEIPDALRCGLRHGTFRPCMVTATRPPAGFIQLMI